MTLCLGPSVVDPRNYEWLMHGDYLLHFMGWHLYRGGPWSWPIGAAPLLIWPVGSSVGLTDSIPVVAIALKPFRWLLPPVFQFIGLWLVLCVALQGVFGVLLMRLATPRVSLQLLGAALLILSPPLYFRIGHAALTAHWLVLASIWLCLRRDGDVGSWRLTGAWALLSAITAATQPYTLLMVMVLMAAAYGRQLFARPATFLHVAAHISVVVAAAAAALWQSGSLMINTREGLEIGGFGVWSANLLTFIMPTEWGTLLSPGPFRYEHREQYEGYAYMGLGILGLALVCVIAGGWSLVRQHASGREAARQDHSLPSSRRGVLWRLRYLPFVLGLLFLTVMALGPKVTLGSRVLFEYDPEWWRPLWAFRTTGRMIWPLYYTAVVFILFAASRRRGAVLLCAMALMVQAVDLSGMVRHVRDVQAFGFRDPLQNRFWDVVPARYKQLELIPPSFCWHAAAVDFSPFALRAGIQGVAINSGLTARFDVPKARAYCDSLRKQIESGLGSDDSLYVVRLDLVSWVLTPPAARVRCTVIDGHGVCFTPESMARWAGEFDVARSRLPETAELLRFYEALNDTYRRVLGRSAVDVVGPHEVRLDTLARYLSYRIEGCEHDEAELVALAALMPGRAQATLCRRTALTHDVPPADHTFAFHERLNDQRGPATTASSYVDIEGEAVWVQAYVRERLRGAREADARRTVITAIGGAAR
jgi:hypothetical protein